MLLWFTHRKELLQNSTDLNLSIFLDQRQLWEFLIGISCNLGGDVSELIENALSCWWSACSMVCCKILHEEVTYMWLFWRFTKEKLLFRFLALILLLDMDIDIEIYNFSRICLRRTCAVQETSRSSTAKSVRAHDFHRRYRAVLSWVFSPLFPPCLRTLTARLNSHICTACPWQCRRKCGKWKEIEMISSFSLLCANEI